MLVEPQAVYVCYGLSGDQGIDEGEISREIHGRDFASGNLLLVFVYRHHAGPRW